MHEHLLDRVAAEVRPDDVSLGDWTKAYFSDHRARLVVDLQLASTRFRAGDRVLEIGSAPYFLTGALQRVGCDLTGIDIHPDRFSGTISRLQLDVVQCDVETELLPFDSSSFDYVLMNEIFEHLRIDPIFTMREVVRVLRPGGSLLLSTPNLRSARGVYGLIFRGYAQAVDAEPFSQYEKLQTLGHMGHVREYTPTEVSHFLEQVGLLPRTLIHRGGETSKRAWARWLYSVWPATQPYFTIVAEKASR